MDTSVFDTITNLIEKSQNILVLTHAKPDVDALGSSLSAYLVFKELGKQITVVTNDPMKDNVDFLPAINTLQYSLGGTKDFVISIDCSKNSISKIKYNAEQNKVNIIITPKDGIFTSKDVSFQSGKAKYDLILVFDTGNVEYLGPIYENNAELFFQAPVVNIDHHPSNTDFGKVNLVVPTAASTTEILFEYFTYLEKKLNKKLITPDVATLLMAGLITDTGSFQNANTSPRSLEVAADLLDLGARQQEIIKRFFKTKKLSTLKLWGLILSKVQVDPAHHMVWSAISLDDLKESEAEPEETEGIIDDLLTNAPGAEVIFLMKENKEGMVSVSMRSTNNAVDVGKFCAENGGGGHVRAAGFRLPIDRPFNEMTSEVVRRVREFQAKRLNIHPQESQVSSASLKSPTTPPAETPRTEIKSEPKPAEKPAQPAEKKVTYLDFAAPKAPKPEETPKPFVMPKPAESQVTSLPAGRQVPSASETMKTQTSERPNEPKPESAVSASGDSSVASGDLGMKKIEEPKPVQPKSEMPKPMAPKPVSVDQKIVANTAQFANQTMHKKHHRKRHHNKPRSAGTPPSNPQQLK